MTIEELIKEGDELKDSVKEVYVPVVYTYYIDDFSRLFTWKEKCLRFLRFKYPEDYSIERFEQIADGLNQSNLQVGLENMVAILRSCQSFPEIIKKRDKLSDGSVNINLTQEQHQDINNSIFLESLKDYTTGAQQKEINTILSSDMPENDKKKNILEKVKSFGIDVLSTIISDVITTSMTGIK